MNHALKALQEVQEPGLLSLSKTKAEHILFHVNHPRHMNGCNIKHPNIKLSVVPDVNLISLGAARVIHGNKQISWDTVALSPQHAGEPVPEGKPLKWDEALISNEFKYTPKRRKLELPERFGKSYILHIPHNEKKQYLHPSESGFDEDATEKTSAEADSGYGASETTGGVAGSTSQHASQGEPQQLPLA
jgi:hypothetical protein